MLCGSLSLICLFYFVLYIKMFIDEALCGSHFCPFSPCLRWNNGHKPNVLPPTGWNVKLGFWVRRQSSNVCWSIVFVGFFSLLLCTIAIMLLYYVLIHRPLSKGRITQQSSPERDESNAFSKNVFLASTEDNNLGAEPKFELIWSNGWKVIGPQFLLHTL
jgi:hypothetical protein